MLVWRKSISGRNNALIKGNLPWIRGISRQRRFHARHPRFWLFILSGLLLNIAPGPDTAYIIGRGIQFGWRGGAAAAIGISCGCLVHVFGAAIGLSALLLASSAAFAAVKLAGAAYLVWLGIQMLLSRARPVAEASVPGDGISLRRVFWQGALTNVLNPKVALFFLAFLPQFVAADSPHKTLAFLVLGLTFISTGTLWCSTGGVRGRAAGRIRQSEGNGTDQPRAQRAVRLSRRSRRHAAGAVNSDRDSQP